MTEAAIPAAFLHDTPGHGGTDTVQLLELTLGGGIELQGVRRTRGKTREEGEEKEGRGQHAVHHRMLPSRALSLV